MLKIVLQPLVENAIYHGIKRRRGRGQITVTGRRQAGGMYFAVEDNGMGMTPERLAEVRASLQNGAPLDPDGKGGYGLRNVEQRLRLYYGCGLMIESEYRHGTRISLSLIHIFLPRRLDMHRPSTNAVTTADSVFISAGISRLKYGSSELPAVAAILSSASALMKCGNRVSATKNEAEPAIRVEQ